jgi:hypothetical protein
VFFCVLFVCKCLLPPGDNPIAVNKYVIQVCTHPWRLVTRTSKFRMVLRNILWAVNSELTSCHLAPRVLRSLLDFWEICAPPALHILRLLQPFSQFLTICRCMNCEVRNASLAILQTGIDFGSKHLVRRRTPARLWKGKKQ